MNLHNEFGIKPGAYHLGKETIVVTDVLTHDTTNPLPEPLVIYRPLVAPVEHVDGKPTAIHRRYSMPVKDFLALSLKEI